MRTVDPDIFTDGTICNLVKITLQNGTVYGYTDHDDFINFDSITNYEPAPGLQKIKMTLSSTSEVSNQELASAWVNVPDGELLNGEFDSAEIEVSWCNWKNLGYGNFVIFKGKLGEITWTAEGFKADIFNHMKALEANMGVVFTGNCRHELFSTDSPGNVGACNVTETYTFESVESIIRNRWIFTIGSSPADGTYSNGMMQIGGRKYIIKSQIGNRIELFLPTSYPILVGDGIQLWPGCDKTLATCKNKFNNVVNYGGFPHIQSDVNFR
jgi:uncharacterized phage protein (TIGR02218 family)